jgi:hypothetical protein
MKHLESLLEVERFQIQSGPDHALFFFSKKNNQGALFSLELKKGIPSRIINRKRHRTPEDATGQMKW